MLYVTDVLKTGEMKQYKLEEHLSPMLEAAGLTVVRTLDNKLSPFDLEVLSDNSRIKIEIETYRKPTWDTSINDITTLWNRGFSIPRRRIKDGVPKSDIFIKQNHSHTSFIGIDLHFVAINYALTQRRSYVSRYNKPDGDPENNQFYELPWDIVKDTPEFIVYDDYTKLVDLIKRKLDALSCT
jgi:hypothetical protein